MSILYIELTTTCKLEFFLYFNLEITKLRTVDLKLSVCWNNQKMATPQSLAWVGYQEKCAQTRLCVVLDCASIGSLPHPQCL